MPYPKVYDLDKNRASFPNSAFGNTDWGNCVKVGQTNQTMRLERIERHVTPRITPPDVIQAYKDECQREFGAAPAVAGDGNDNGLVMLYNFRNWRTVGWDIFLAQNSKKKTNQRIYAYGELTNDREQLRRACYILRGIQFGINLPLTARQQLNNNQPWDVVNTSDPSANAGSWGGHCVYSCHYDPSGWIVKTWGRNQRMTNEFVEKYADERWAVVDAQDPLGKNSRWLDVDAMMNHLRNIGAVVDG